MVLAGGVGSRFWPVSTPTRPKQLLPLAGPQPLIAQTIERVLPLVPRERIRILTGEHLRRPILAAVPSLDDACIMAEPVARGTAPALAWAAAEIARLDAGAILLSLHADHAIAPAHVFREALAAAGSAAGAYGRLFTIGARPTRAETGYGYIQPGATLDERAGALAVASFVEKPVLADAERYVRDGYLWNTGIFALPARLLLEEMAAHTPELAPLLPLLEQGDVASFFQRAPSLTIDHGLLERSARVGVLPAAFDWDDVGAWDALARTRTPDGAGNIVIGDAHLVESSGCIAWSEDGSLVTFGTHDLVVVHANGITFVAPRDRAPDLKRLLERLPAALREPGERMQ